jgi:hypothetical protein
VLPELVPLGFIGVFHQIPDQPLYRRQMIVTGASPGHVIQKAVDIFGNTSASRVLQAPFADKIIDKMNAFRDRTLVAIHK